VRLEVLMNVSCVRKCETENGVLGREGEEGKFGWDSRLLLFKLY
jgi:hypothetical protein